MFRFFWKSWLKLAGWNTDIQFPAHIKKMVIIVAPHTSTWDFPLGLAYRSVCRMKNTHFLGKAELFKKPFGFIFSWLGGTPVDRKSKQNVVEQVTAEFNKHEEFILAIAPEGTRKKVDNLRTGFYFIAKAAKVPILMTGLDFENKTLVVAEPFFPSDDEAADFKKIIHFFGPIKGGNAELGLSHLMNESDQIKQ